MERLSGKIAAVTGGASGIGEATVRRFVAEGAKVAFADRDVDRGKRVAAEIEATGGQALFVEAHVERETEAAGFIQQTAMKERVKMKVIAQRIVDGALRPPASAASPA